LSGLRRLTAGRDQLHAEELQEEITAVSAQQIADCADREMIDVAGTLRTVTLRPRGPSLTMEADLWDGSGHITLVWLGRRDIPGIRPGRSIVVHGRAARIRGELTMYNPAYELRSSGAD
jgi:RecG-like helicase